MPSKYFNKSFLHLIKINSAVFLTISIIFFEDDFYLFLFEV